MERSQGLLHLSKSYQITHNMKALSIQQDTEVLKS